MTLLVACEPLTDVAGLSAFNCGCQIDEVVDIVGTEGLAEIIDAASDIVAEATGRRVTGRCEVTVRPCVEGVCGCAFKCTCCNIDGVKLFGTNPVVSEVKVDGTTMAPELYRLIDGRVLVKVNGSSWPGLQNVAKSDTEVGTFSIRFSHGVIPWVARMAANEMACDLIQASIPNGAPKLPPGAINALMDGTTIQIDPHQLLGFPWMQRLTGLYDAGPAPVIWSPEVEGTYKLHHQNPNTGAQLSVDGMSSSGVA